MPEEIEVETKDLQEAIEELHKERGEREELEKAGAWTRYISLSTALLAVFAAIGAMKSGSLVNEAMIEQLQASDKWNEYQAARQKSHLYSLQAFSIIDQPRGQIASSPPQPKGRWSPKSPADRLKDFEGQVKKEEDKAKDLSEKATHLEKESEHLMHTHHKFAGSVAYIQVAIALGAISALTKIKPVWLLSIIVGTGGIYFFTSGFLAIK